MSENKTNSLNVDELDNVVGAVADPVGPPPFATRRETRRVAITPLRIRPSCTTRALVARSPCTAARSTCSTATRATIRTCPVPPRFGMGPRKSLRRRLSSALVSSSTQGASRLLRAGRCFAFIARAAALKYASTWRLKVKLLGEVEDGLAVAHAGDGLEACLAASTRSPSWLDWKHAHLGFGAAST